MKNRIALALTGILLVMIVTFAPITTATWHGLPDVQNDTYIVTGGESSGLVALDYGPVPLDPDPTPFSTRGPELTPQVQWQDINFSMAIDPTGGMLPGPALVFLTVPWTSIQSLEHVYFSGTLGYTRVKLLPIPGSDGMGWLYLLPGIADVDIHVVNTFMLNPMPGPYNVTNPPEIPIVLWAATGAPAAVPGTGNLFYPFPDPGADTLPGFCPMGAGTQDDGFGDGVPDPAGSSVLFLPMQLSVESWNGTAWVFTFGGPFILPMTTGVASDMVIPGPTPTKLDNETIMYMGAPWEDVHTTLLWGANENKKFVTYAYAWSFIKYYLTDGPPIVKLNLIYGGYEKKVKDVHVINDISCDNKVDIVDIVIAALAFGARDEGSPAYAGYDPTGKGSPGNVWPGPYPPYMPSPWLVEAEPTLEGGVFDARADLNNDGLIDIVDLVKIALDFGEEIDP
jgi:hypothetical protein